MLLIGISCGVTVTFFSTRTTIYDYNYAAHTYAYSDYVSVPVRVCASPRCWWTL